MIKNTETKETPTKNKGKNAHPCIRCDKCSKFPIIGTRYKCLVCFDYDHCEECESKYPHEHDMIVLKSKRNR